MCKLPQLDSGLTNKVISSQIAHFPASPILNYVTGNFSPQTIINSTPPSNLAPGILKPYLAPCFPSFLPGLAVVNDNSGSMLAFLHPSLLRRMPGRSENVVYQGTQVRKCQKQRERESQVSLLPPQSSPLPSQGRRKGMREGGEIFLIWLTLQFEPEKNPQAQFELQTDL